MPTAAHRCPTDAELAALIDGSAAPDHAASVREHIDSCESCAGLVAALVRGTTRSTPALLDPGATAGRYVVRAVVGAGAMGVVYRAFDPELQREVALKLVRPRVAEAAATMERLRRESRALARLRDPNVIAVYDVGQLAGDEGQIFIAMEFVDGTTLRHWLERPRSWREIVDVFVQAGRGLAAAHRAGLVHRDFKPDNVLVGVDGRVQVTDFGLARAVADEPSSGGGDGPIELESLAHTLTQSGTRVGTPLYMAPEQIEGREVGPAADQFAFAVASFTALAGERPFAGDTAPVLFANVLAGSLRAVRWTAPRHLLTTLRRALAVDPQARHRNMDELLAALARDDRPRRHAMIGVAVVATTVGGGVWFRSNARERAQQDCIDLAVPRVWSTDARDDLRHAMAATASYGGDVFDRVAPRIDAWAERWRSGRERACMAATVDHSVDPRVASLSAACFEHEIDAVAGVIERLAGGAAPVLARAAQLTSELPDSTSCEDPRWLDEHVAPELEGEHPEERAEVRRALEHVRIANNAGSYDEARTRLVDLAPTIETLDDAVIRAQAALELGMVAEYTQDPASAERTISEAFHLGMRARDDEIAARAAVMLISVTGSDMGDETKAAHWSALATSTLSRLESPPPRLEVMRLRALGLVAASKRRFLEATAFHRTALEYARAQLGERHPLVVSLLSNLASNAMARGETTDGIARLEEVIALREADLGPDHPGLAGPLINLGNAQQMLLRNDDALATYARAEALCRAQSLPALADLLANRAHLHVRRGDLEAAQSDTREALALELQRHPPEHPRVLEARYLVARVALDRGDPAEARRELESAESVTPSPPDPTLQPRVALELTRVRRLEGDAAGALVELDGLRERLEREAPDLLDRAARLRAAALTALGRSDEAIAALSPVAERDTPGDPEEMWLAQRELADLLATRDPARAATLRRRADALEQQGPPP